MEKIKILLVEENEMVRYYFRDAFWLHGQPDAYEISFANGFSEARTYLREAQDIPDIIFFDLILHGNIDGKDVFAPEIGFQLLKEIRLLPRFNPSRIVIFSSPDYFSLWRKAKGFGANYFLKKDQFLPKHLVKWVDEIMIKSDGTDYRTEKSKLLV